MLQENESLLRNELLQSVKPDESLCEQILNMGFDIEMIRQVLKETANDMGMAIERLLQMQASGTYQDALKEVLKNAPAALGDALNQASTSTAQSLQDREDEMEVSLILGLHLPTVTNMETITFRLMNVLPKTWRWKTTHIWTYR